MTKAELKYTFADHCSGAIRFASDATGSILDSDLPPGFEREAFTSDPVCNQVDFYTRPYEDIYSVIVVQVGPGMPLLPPSLTTPPFDLLAGHATDYFVPIVPVHLPVAKSPVAVDAPSGTPELAAVARRVRDLAGLPVNDVARMIGIGRRQFYNLLERGSSSPETELRLRHLEAQLERLASVVGEDSAAIRSALLTPIGAPPRSLFEAALASEDASLGGIFDALMDRIERRGLRQVRRAVPRRRSGEAASDRLREALDGLPVIDLDPEAGSER
jgi:transcriptional regulator with XRE-family HTH domain